MKPVSTGTLPCGVGHINVLECPPILSSASIKVTSCRWDKSHAAESPDIPDPTTAILREFNSLRPCLLFAI